MPYYRVTLDTYVEGDYASPEEAKDAFQEMLDDDCDQHGRTVKELMGVETFNCETEKWE